MIAAICWDVGGVFSGRPVDAIADVAAEHDLDADAVFTAVFGPYHLDGDHSWHRVERGEIPLQEAWADVEAAIGELGVALILKDFFSRFGTDEADRFSRFGTDEADRTVVTGTVRELHGRGIAQATFCWNTLWLSRMVNSSKAMAPANARPAQKGGDHESHRRGVDHPHRSR